MPLPAALLARLKKRGIVTEERELEPEAPHEEVIAESYDEPEKPEEPPGAPGCPNKSNSYHRCTLFCYERWSGGLDLDIDVLEMDRKRRRMLRKYPLPRGWEEVFDADSGRYYYWEPESDDVCWLSPKHPRAEIVFGPNHKEQEFPPSPEAFYDPDSNAAEVEEEKGGKTRGKKRPAKKDGPLDPMDPAAYSDVSEGTWSSGLDMTGEAKTGVDHTVTGPLFQQRPYPAPGAILRQNAKGKKTD